ncbi:unnamed protein product [Calypogeia fissa]
MASAAGSTPLATGCFKCGRTGHWGRDCPFKPGGTPASRGGASGDRTPSTAGGFDGASSGRFSNSGGYNGGSSWKGKDFQGKGKFTPGSKSVPKEPVKKEPRKRPNLTPDLLLSERGLGYVLEKMPEMVTIKGREDTVVRDLKSLLEGYMHWHSLLLPYFSFDQFVEKVQKVGATKRVRVCTRELRDKIVYGKESTGDKDAEVEANEGSSPTDPLPKDKAADPVSDASRGPPDASEAPRGSPDDIFTNDDDILTNEEPELPVNDEEFEEFFRQGTVEQPSEAHPPSTMGGGSAPPGLQSNSSPVRKFPSLEDEGSTKPPESATTIAISESAAARMEANRLKALERAKARQAKTVQL